MARRIGTNMAIAAQVGCFGLRVNERYRITFTWQQNQKQEDPYADAVTCQDYH